MYEFFYVKNYCITVRVEFVVKIKNCQVSANDKAHSPVVIGDVVVLKCVFTGAVTVKMDRFVAGAKTMATFISRCPQTSHE